MKIEELHNIFLKSEGIVIDTRKIIKDSIFFAIKGEKFDANTFTEEALNNGASYVIIDNKEYFIDQRTILVDNVLKTLQELAKYHRTYLNIPIIALTGSNGKTTTKELINQVLSQKYNTKATIGNLNNHIGVPLTLLSFSKNTEIGIVEMGANHQKEIEFLCNLANPDYGYITNFGKAHLEGFGGIEGVIKGKSEMYNYLNTNQKTVFVNLDDKLQEEKTRTIKRYTFSQSQNDDADIKITKTTANPLVRIEFNYIEINSNLIGLYNSNNIAAAITIGNFFNVPNLDIKKAIESYIPENNRSQIILKNSNEIILDAYNANPTSMLLALENFIQLDKKNKIIIIGDMFELGNESDYEHKNIIKFLEKIDEINCFFIGNYFYKNKISKNNFSFFKDFEQFKSYLNIHTLLNNTILIKGSRGIALERVLEFI
ncbi:MAG: UDP-N-acetylmuramoyl-tripeptide--D-alanyl-D-alanine ligase [Flavobacteriaceae bacterium]|nr:UDP-N-acetylmuramoyl-tripeptide--D-alanyl-D-alanine ligase [Flavobacteriaceae bacterium]